MLRNQTFFYVYFDQAINLTCSNKNRKIIEWWGLIRARWSTVGNLVQGNWNIQVLWKATLLRTPKDFGQNWKALEGFSRRKLWRGSDKIRAHFLTDQWDLRKGCVWCGHEMGLLERFRLVHVNVTHNVRFAEYVTQIFVLW